MLLLRVACVAIDDRHAGLDCFALLAMTAERWAPFNFAPFISASKSSPVIASEAKQSRSLA